MEVARLPVHALLTKTGAEIRPQRAQTNPGPSSRRGDLIMVRKGRAVWRGTGKDGTGDLTTDTDSGRRTRLGFLCGREAGRLVGHESRRQAMARVADHLSVEDLEARLRSAQDPTATRHVQVIWLF